MMCLTLSRKYPLVELLKLKPDSVIKHNFCISPLYVNLVLHGTKSNSNEIIQVLCLK